jgi:RNA polymerase sigma factor (sigma-70 family)
MATNRLRTALGQLQLALAPPEGDGLLLARFVADRDEAAFAALVRRHGPMVLGVCRRVLRHAHDAEDAFQATFLVLARKAASVLKREALGSWLYGVAYRTARKQRSLQARRQAREKQVDEMPHPQVQPEEVHDWRPLLDRELNRLPEKYRAPVVLCDLGGRPHREAARQLGLPAGTFARRLAAGRRLLAERLSRRGVALSGGALAAALSQATASAKVAAPLVVATAKAAVWVAAGHLAAVATPVAVLTKGVLRAMFLAKLKVVVGVALVVAALGAGGVAYRSADAQTLQSQQRAEGKPRSEVEALRRENELLKLNLEVVLEKVRAQEAELRDLRGRAKPTRYGDIFKPDKKPDGQLYYDREKPKEDRNLKGKVGDAGSERIYGSVTKPKVEERSPAEVADQIEVALKRLLEAKDDSAHRRALESLGQALRKLRELPRQPRRTDLRYEPLYEYEAVPQTKKP